MTDLTNINPAILLETYHQLVIEISSSNTTIEIRQNAEKKLNEIQLMDNFWYANIQIFNSTEEPEFLFFLCQGLQKFIWKKWNHLSSESQSTIATTIMTLLYTKGKSLPLYARSKAEQLIGAICSLANNIDPVLQILSDPSQPNGIVGICALKTVLEDVMTMNPRLTTAQQAALFASAEASATTATLLAYNGCLYAFKTQSNSISQEQGHMNIAHRDIFVASLDLLKTIINKIQVGGHITVDLLNLLFEIAEGEDEEVSVLSVEVLAELMSKRYIPRADGDTNDAGSYVLMSIVIKAVSLLRKYRVMENGLEDSIVALPLLEFLLVFCESGQLERCLRSNTSGMQTGINSFLEEVAALSCTSMEPNILLKVLTIWEALLSIEILQPLISSMTDTIALPVTTHTVTACLIQGNRDYLIDILDEIEQELSIEPFSDAYINVMVGNLTLKSNKKSNSDACGAEEVDCVATAIRSAAIRVLANFSQPGNSVSVWLAQNITKLSQECIESVTCRSGFTCSPDLTPRIAAIDLCFAIKLLPLCVPRHSLIEELANLMTSLVENRIFSQGVAQTALFVTCGEILGQLYHSMQSIISAHGKAIELSGGEIASNDNEIGTAILNLPKIAKIVLLACDTSITPAPLSISGSSSSLLLKALTAASNVIYCSSSNGTASIANEITALLNTSSVMATLAYQPIEIQTLIVCCHDKLCPNELSTSLVTQLLELNHIDINGDQSQLSNLNRISICLDTLVKFHSTSNPTVRTAFSTTLLPLQEELANIYSKVLAYLEYIYDIENSPSQPILKSQLRNLVLTSCKLILSLSSSMLQSLGKKSFGVQSNMNLQLCVSSLTSRASTYLLRDNIGLDVLKQMFILTSTIALATSSKNNNFESETSHQLLSITTGCLSDTRICLELLAPILKAGTDAVNSYMHFPTVELLIQLCVNCLDPSVSPQDVLIALEGVIKLGKQRNVFNDTLFLTHGSWLKLVHASLRALLLRAHSMHIDYIIELLVNLSVVDLSKVTPPSPLEAGLWAVVHNIIIDISTGVGCNDIASQMIASLANEDTSRLDMSSFINKICQPLSAEIARVVDSA